ncbi:MAG TPA: MFS transporter [Armatimonadota bacterium]|nr:MFS transporter [Armatimonadota bacterium]
MDESLKRRFASFYFLLFVPIGIHAPYLFLYFKRQGFTDSQLGTLAAVTPLLNVFAPPLWGALADMLGDRRRMLAALLLSAALIFPWLAHAGSFRATLALMVVFSAFAFPPVAIADAITMENVERRGGDYGRLRMWGSLGFAMPLIAFGLILGKGAGQSAASLYPIFISYAIFRLLSAGCVGMLPPSYGERRGFFDLRAVKAFANWRFVALAACALVAMGAMSAYYLYFTIYLDEVGIADNLKGYFWAIAVASETAMMLVIGGLVRRIGLKWTFVLGIFGCVLRLFAFSCRLGPGGIAAVQLLHCLTFTTFTVSTITFVSRLTPPELRASGQTLWMALTGGLGAAAGSKLSGVCAGALGLMGMFRVFSGVAAAALLAAVIFVKEPPEPAPPPASADE